MNEMIEVSLNNQSCQIAQACTVAAALQGWGYADDGLFAVAVNQVFVPRQNYADHLLADRDQVDIVEPISGG